MVEGYFSAGRGGMVATVTGAMGKLGVRARLGLLVVVSTLVWGSLSSLSHSPWIFADELIYTDLARSLAAGRAPSVRGVVTYGYGLVYPLLTASAWVVTSNASVAFALVRLLDALVMSLAAVPAFLLARRFVPERTGFIVAALSVAIPSMAYAATLMSEVALYPVFLFALLCMARALERRSGGAQVLALGAIALAAATKILAAALLPALALAILLLTALEKAHDGRTLAAGLARFRLTWLVLGAGAVAATGVATARDSSLLSLFGAYAEAVRSVDLLALPVGVVRHVAVLSVYTAVVPLAATAIVVVLALLPGADRRLRLFAALTVPSVLCTAGGVAVFASYASGVDYQERGIPSASPLYERNLFVVVPLLLVGLGLWMEHGLQRPRRLAGVVAATCVILLAVYPWSLLPNSANPQNLAATVWLLLPGPSWLIPVVACATAAVVATFWLRLPTGAAWKLWLIVGSWFAFAGLLSIVVFTGISGYAARTGAGSPPDWIDRRVGDDARVLLLWRESPAVRFAPPSDRQRIVWLSEIYNESVREVHVLGGRLPFGLADGVVHVEADGTVVDAQGQPLASPFVLAECSLGVVGPVVAIDRKTHMAVSRTSDGVRLGLSGGRTAAC